MNRGEIEMKRRLSPAFPVLLTLLLALVLAMPAAAQSLSEGNAILEEGIDAFRRSDFDTAVLRFREILLEDPDADLEANAYFWLSKSAMALGRLTEAERNLEYYIRTFPSHEFAVEARYQRGRLLFMQEDYAAAVEALSSFVEQYPESPFVANAIYWSGESLYTLGRFNDARRLFDSVVPDYPRSFRVEAARYRIALIDLNERETELLQLLRWSHEEYLKTIDDFERRDRAYQEAIAAYQQRLQNAADEGSRQEIIRLTTQVRSLQETLRNRDAEIQRLQEQLTTLQNARE
jgi:TolA-binding protein